MLTQFKTLNGFNEAIQKRKELKKFYKEELIPLIKEEKKFMKQQRAMGRAGLHTAQASILRGPTLNGFSDRVAPSAIGVLRATNDGGL